MKTRILAAVLAAALAVPGLALAKEEAAPAAPPVQSFKAEMAAAEKGMGLLGSSLHAATALAGYLVPAMDRDAAIMVASFVNLENLDDSSPFGRLVAHQIGSGLSQAGFRVLETRLRNRLVSRVQGGEFFVTRDLAQALHSQYEAFAALVGFYSVTRDEVYVSARLSRLEDGGLLAAYEYVLPNRGAVAQLFAPKDYEPVWAKHAMRKPALATTGAPPVVISPPRPVGAGGVPGLEAKPVPEGFPELGPPVRIH
jgi:TolB-like protein